MWLQWAGASALLVTQEWSVVSLSPAAPPSSQTYLWNTLRLVVGQQVVVEFGTVKHACEGFGRRGEGLGCEAVVARHAWSPAVGFRGLFAGSVYRRLLRETLVRQEVGLNGVLPSTRLGCGRDAELGQLGRLGSDRRGWF